MLDYARNYNRIYTATYNLLYDLKSILYLGMELIINANFLIGAVFYFRKYMQTFECHANEGDDEELKLYKVERLRLAE